MSFFFIGEFTVKDNTTGKTAAIGKTKLEDIESNFGAKYESCYGNEFASFPDKNGDGVASMEEVSTKKMLVMYFDEETGLFSPVDFAYLNS